MPKLEEAIRLSGFNITRVFHGANNDSPDRLAGIWGQQHEIAVRPFPMESEYDLRMKNIPTVAAGPRRNKRMKAAGAEGVIALWNGKSPGTKSMVKMMYKKYPVFVFRLDGASHERFPKQLLLL